MTTENLAPQVISRLLGEIREVCKTPPDGCTYEAGEEETVSEIHAIISGPDGTPFAGGKFRMKLVLSEDYPNTPPKGYFLTKIYHPNVAPNGDICVNTLKKDWTSETTLKHILQVIRCLLIVPFPESSLNDEAGKLFMESYDEFARRAKIMTEVHALPISCDSGSDLKKSIAVVDDSAASAVASIVSEEQKKVKDAKKKSLKRL